MTKTTSTPNTYTPQYSTVRHDKGVIVNIDLPGVSKEDVTITSEKQQLHVTATRKSHTPDSWTLLNQVERPNAYLLKLNVHKDLDLSKAAAQFNNGVLSLNITKRQQSLPRQINITD